VGQPWFEDIVGATGGQIRGLTAPTAAASIPWSASGNQKTNEPLIHNLYWNLKSPSLVQWLIFFVFFFFLIFWVGYGV
jgi:hypothetical protein